MQRPFPFLIVLGAVALIAVFLGGRLVPSPGAPSPFESKVRAYLMGHPDVARDVVAKLDAQDSRMTETSPPAAAAPEPEAAKTESVADPETAAEMDTAEIVRRVLNDTPATQIAGNLNGDVTVVLFFDYRCPYCKAGVAQQKAFLAADPNARIVYRDLGILGEPSVTAARAALAAARQHKYMPLHDALMDFRGEFNDTDIFGLAMQVGLDIEQLKADMQDPVIAATLTANLALARALKVEGTPAYVIGGHVVSGFTSHEELEELANEVRSHGKQQVGAAQ